MNRTIYALPLILATLCAPAFAQETTTPLITEPAAAADTASEETTPAEASAAVAAPVEASAPTPEPAVEPAPEPAAEEPAPALPAGYGKSMVDAEMLDYIRKKVNTDLVFMMVKNQNKRYVDVTEEKITELDAQWVAEREQQEQPLITATLSNPLSSYLMMVQAHSYGLINQVFVMDNKGLNVGQSDISSDYWQGDEAKWQKTFLIGPDAVLIDDPEFDGDKHMWIAQTTIALADPETGEAIGAATFDINLTELKRLRAAGAKLK